MNLDEFLSWAKSNGATMIAPSNDRSIQLTNSALQQMRASILPMNIIEFFRKSGGMFIGDSFIFGPEEYLIDNKFPVPSIVQINRELEGINQIRGFTVFGRNSLFWFAFDAFGNSYMLDNMTLARLRKYEDTWRAMSDCLTIGKI